MSPEKMQPSLLRVKPVSLISLTDPGLALAQRLLALLPGAEHLHRPQPFQESVRERFLAGRRLIYSARLGL